MLMMVAWWMVAQEQTVALPDPRSRSSLRHDDGGPLGSVLTTRGANGNEQNELQRMPSPVQGGSKQSCPPSDVRAPK